MDLQISLRALDPEMADAWREVFQGAPQVDIAVGSVLDSTADAIVSPSNSFGYMDGGIDLAYREFFGPEIEDRLRQHLKTHHHGELTVGQAVVLETQHAVIPYLISAPTMRVPLDIDETVNVYLAFRAALLAAVGHTRRAARPIRSMLSPAFGTGIGVATGTIRWLFVALCTAIYISIAYLASLDFRGGQGVATPGGFLAWAMSVARHVVLIPGALPLAVVIVWALRVRSWHTFLLGAALVVCMLLYHYVLFAVSAHSDTAYPWFQLGEFVLLWFVLKWLLRQRGANG